MTRKLKPQPKVAVAKKKPPRWQRERNISLLIWIIIPLVIVLALGLVGYWAYDTYVAPWQQAVAKVNDTTIDMRYFVKMLRVYPQQSPDQVLSRIMSDELIRQGATKLGIEASPEEITERIENGLLPDQGNATDTEIDLDQHYELVSQQTGLSVAEYRKIREIEVLIPKIKDQIVPEEAKHVYLFTLERPTEAEALQAREELLRGNATLEEELAEGDLGWVPQGIYPEFDEAFGLEAGNLTRPVETSGDEESVYAFAKVSEIAESMKLDEEHRETLAVTQFEKWLEEEKNASTIEWYLDQDKINWAVDHI